MRRGLEMGRWLSGLVFVWRGSGEVVGGGFSFPSTWAKRSFKGCLKTKHENIQWHQKQFVYKSSALGPFKNSIGERCSPNMKIQ